MDGDLLLLNYSFSLESPPEYRIFTDVDVDSSVDGLLIKNLSVSQCGDYRVECWRKGNMTNHQSFCLTICADGDGWSLQEDVRFDDGTVICRLDSALGARKQPAVVSVN